MRFSQRIGKKPIKTELQIEGISPELKNALWSAFLECIVNNIHDSRYGDGYDLTRFCKTLWINFFKDAVDRMPHYANAVMVVNKEAATIALRKWFYASETQWDDLLDFIEFCSQNLYENSDFVSMCNTFFEREMSAYRIVGDEVVQITSEEEIAEIEQALNVSDKFSPARTHLQAALQLLSDKKNPDFRNSMKESISAVEALCKIITGDKNATLGDSLKVIEKKYPLHESLKKAFSALYGYTSDSGGIRHSLKDEVPDLKFEDAKFMLVICSAFVNYLIAKTT